ncbi:MAG: hypothetical protein ACP5OE_08795 [Thermodesulfobium sp.]
MNLQTQRALRRVLKKHTGIDAGSVKLKTVREIMKTIEEMPEALSIRREYPSGYCLGFNQGNRWRAVVLGRNLNKKYDTGWIEGETGL